ncbi:penicillin-binding protein [Burkholderia cepacia]|uniref:peptidoglycan D,D-transpeptidase FtsI family protein n=1 Tax=Burkholderia cepacia TaxID=292 RepID=UPI00075C683C|nr:penicillin-binding protein 2 [Burkholderia cepacia]KVQ34471.1 penicillin-binding protein [Burkholderia cepacia]
MIPQSISFHRSTVAKSALPAWRSHCVLFLISMCFIALFVRAFWVQCIRSDFYIRQGRKRYEHAVETVTMRGRVLDRNGSILAINEPVQDVWIVPSEFRQATDDERRSIASLLGTPEAELSIKAHSDKKFLYLQRQVGVKPATRIATLSVPGVHMTVGVRRYYPGGSDFAQLVGFIGLDGHGLEGVEMASDGTLTGTPGRRDIIVDRMGRPVENVSPPLPGKPGSDIALSIDRRIQHLAMIAVQRSVTRFAATAGCAIVLDARTGEILALANLPTFDPNLEAAPYDDRFRNRALSDVFEPGSTIKPVTVALALQEQVVTPDTHFDTSPGVLKIYGSLIHDTSDHGDITVTQVIAKSSNIGMVKIAGKLSPKDMWQMFRSFGIGERPIADFPSAERGTLRPALRWKPIEQATMAYGYGLSVSLSQLADTYTVFAHDGVRQPLSLQRIQSPRGGVSVISPDTAREIRKMLEAAVAPGGTAAIARLPDYRVGAKTGTARKQSGVGYARGKYRAMFVGMAPMSDPRLIVAVMIDEPSRGSYYGGPVAGPVFAEIMENSLHLLGVPPDLPIAKHP